MKITNKEVMLKDKSHFKQSTGNEAGAAAKKGVVTSVNKGKVYFTAWSMDVKFEGENVVRNLDLMTHNHASVPGNTVTWPYLDGVATEIAQKCEGDKKKEKDACKDYQPHKDDGPSPCPSDSKPNKATVEAYADKTAANECLAARRCMLVPYEPTSKQAACCSGQTGHHIVEAGSFFNKGRGGSKSTPVADTSGYNTGKAPCICVEGTNQYQGTHGLMHTFQSTAALDLPDTGKRIKLEDGTMGKEKATTYGQAKSQGVAAVKSTFPESNCNADCLEAQLDAYHGQHGINDDTECRQVVTGYSGSNAAQSAQDTVARRSERLQSSLTSGAAGGGR